MPRALKFTLIGCGGLIGLVVLVGIVGAIVGGGGGTGTEVDEAQQAEDKAQQEAEKAKEEAQQKVEKAQQEAAEAREQAEQAKEEAAQAKREAEEAEQAKEKAVEAEEAPPAPEEQGDTGTAIIRITGTRGGAFTGSYGNIDTTRSVDGTIPAEYKQKVDTGLLSFDSVSATFQKNSGGAWKLTVQIVHDGKVVKQASTMAQYGVVNVVWSPSE